RRVAKVARIKLDSGRIGAGLGDFGQHRLFLLRIAFDRRYEVRNEVGTALVVGLQVAPFGVHILFRSGDAVDSAACQAERGKDSKDGSLEHGAGSGTGKRGHSMSPWIAWRGGDR